MTAGQDGIIRKLVQLLLVL